MMWGLASNDEFKECTWKNLYVTVVWDIKNTLFVRFGTRCMLVNVNQQFGQYVYAFELQSFSF